MQIDQIRLRKYFADADAAHGALMSTNARVAAARDALGLAKRALDRAVNPMPGVKMIDDVGQASLRNAVALAETDFRRITEERDRLSDVWEHAANLRARVREYAEARGALPDDLREI